MECLLILAIPMLLALLPYIMAIEQTQSRIHARNAKAQRERTHERKEAATLAAQEAKTELLRAQTEAKIAHDDNRAVEQSLRIELLELKLQAERRKVDQPFNPKDYS